MATLEQRYLDELKGRLTRIDCPDMSLLNDDPRGLLPLPFDLERRIEGRDWPTEAETMIGWHRLTNVQTCVTAVVHDNVPGDLLEAGVWRGGSAILMRAVLAAYGDKTRKVWLADSFQGLPPPDVERYPADRVATTWEGSAVAVSLDEVRRNFDRYGLLDDQVRFLPGWFRETLPGAPVDQLAVLRLDGDLYESTIVALEALYPKLSIGGYCIVDDYGARLPGFGDRNPAREAVDDYRAQHSIDEPIEEVDWTGVYWQRAQ